MSGEFAEFDESAPVRLADKDPATGTWGQERAHGVEQYPVGGDRDMAQRREVAPLVGELMLNDGWGEPARSDDPARRVQLCGADGDDDQTGPALGELAIDDGWGESVSSDHPANGSRGVEAGVASPASNAAEARDAVETKSLEEATEARDAEPVTLRRADGLLDDGWGVELGPQASTPQADSTHTDLAEESAVAPDVIAERTGANRIALADDVRAIELKPTYDGYLDVVMHGDESGTQADVRGDRIDFTLPQTAEMIESSPSWERRPIRLLSCSTGQEGYAQELADRLKVPVYAPNGVLEVAEDGITSIDSPDGTTEGAWRRFEPRL